MTDINTVKAQVDQFLHDTMDARMLCERDRDYHDHKQWTDAEITKLQSRNQAPIVVNRIKPKVEGLIGLYNMRRTDPKAFARTKKHEKASHAITDTLRFVADQNDLQTLKMECAGDFWVEGTAGCIIDVRQKKDGKIKINISRIPWDRLYYDTHSRRFDFEDTRYRGLMLWVGEDELLEMFPDAPIDEMAAEHTDETFEDRPRWQDTQRKRYRLAYHFYKKDGAWWYCIFSGNTFLVKPQESPFLDDEGEPTCIIELVSANIDRENQRYGEVRGYIPLQDEINHRRSKALHLLSQRQTFGRKGEKKDMAAVKRELAKADGHIEFNGNEFGKDFGLLPTNDMAQGQFELLMEAKAELDAVGVNAQLSGERQQGDLSGKAIDKLQMAGTLELNRQFILLSNWEKRIYRQIWARIKQFWTEEEWIRVTDDYDNLRFVGLNTQITAQEWLEEQINDEALDPQTRKKAAASFQFLMQAAQGPSKELIAAAQQGDQQAIQAVQAALQAKPVAEAKLQEPVSVRNPVPDIDVDIILDQSFDSINVQQEQFQLLAQFGQGQDIDIIELIELSEIRGKEQLIEKIEKRRAAAAEAAGNVAALEAKEKQVKIAETMSKVQMNTEEAIQKKIENTLLIAQPTPVSSVSV